MIADFLAEIEAERHDLLLRGGDNPRRPLVHAPFVPTWTPAGEVAHILRSTCLGCGCQTDVLVGVFSRFTSPDGAVRKTALDLNSLGDRRFPVEYQHLRAPVCALCIPSANHD